MKSTSVILCTFVSMALVQGQNGPLPKQRLISDIPITSEWVLQGVRSTQKPALRSVVKIVCPKSNLKGTGFLLKNGLLLTNAHVVSSCSASELQALSSMGEPFGFSDSIIDTQKDLAISKPASPQVGDLELRTGDNVPVEEEVCTWGYPLAYEGPAPLFSAGYVAGYSDARTTDGARPVKHLIINGAFNPGNSGGPLLDRRTGKLIGIVVQKWTLYSPQISAAVQGFANARISTMGTFSMQDAQGRAVPVSDQAVMASVLNELYQKAQVVIGEAIAVTEIRQFIDEHKEQIETWAPLAASGPPPVSKPIEKTH